MTGRTMAKRPGSSRPETSESAQEDITKWDLSQNMTLSRTKGNGNNTTWMLTRQCTEVRLNWDQVKEILLMRFKAGNHTGESNSINLAQLTHITLAENLKATLKTILPEKTKYEDLLKKMLEGKLIARVNNSDKYFVTQASAQGGETLRNNMDALERPLRSTEPYSQGESYIPLHTAALPPSISAAIGQSTLQSEVNVLLKEYFFPQMFHASAGTEHSQANQFIFDHATVRDGDCLAGLFGTVKISSVDGGDQSKRGAYDPEGSSVYLSVKDPFFIVAVGLQGAGKSHSLGVVMENCLIHCPPYLQTPAPLATLVFHYDQDPQNICEAVGVGQPLARFISSGVISEKNAVDSTIVLVSPTYYIQRKRFYDQHKSIKVLPLLFQWESLSAEFISILMRVDANDDMPLYMSTVFDILRNNQKEDKVQTFSEFKTEITTLMKGDKLMPSQIPGLKQRLGLLESLMYNPKDKTQADALKDGGGDVATVLRDMCQNNQRHLVVVDLTNPMLSGPEANGIFHVLLSMFVAINSPNVGKLVVFDEAHKYLQPTSSDRLSAKVVSIVRQMRHYGIRVALSTQSPKTIPPELLELCSMALLHQFHSQDWFNHLQTKIPLPTSLFSTIMALEPGSALMFARKWPATLPNDLDQVSSLYVRQVRIRPRLTVDMGDSKVHNIGAP